MVVGGPTLKLNSGHTFPQVGLGTWLSKPGEAGQAVKDALSIGYRHIDCATIYGNQEEIGKVLHDTWKSGKVKREDVFLTSKIWNTFHSYEKAKVAIDSILKDLQLQYVDLVLIHWPMGYTEGGEAFPKDASGNSAYSDADYVDTWKAMEEAVKAGKVRSIGLSNFNIKQIERVIKGGTIKPAVLQVEVHPYFPQTQLLEWCKQHDIVITAYSPLANNTHIGRKEGQPNLLEEKVLIDIGNKHKKTAAQVALRWAIQRGTVAIPKSVRRVRLEENFSLFDFELTADELKAVDGLDRNLRLALMDRDLKHPHYPFDQ